MTLKIKYIFKLAILWVAGGCLILTVFSGCRPSARVLTIGIASSSSSNDSVPLKGFKEGMFELGYIEGKDIRYIYKGNLNSQGNGVDDGIKELLEQDLDILLVLGRDVSIRAKKLVQGTDMPVLFTGNAQPLEDGLVESLSHPGGNITGVMVTNNVSKAMEWLMTITSGAKKVCIPYNPDDSISVAELAKLERDKPQIEMIPYVIHSVEEAVKTIEALPQDVDAVFLIPSPTLSTGSRQLVRAAVKRGIPTGSSIMLDESVLITFASDFYRIGKQTARLAQMINNGVKPSELPVEMSEMTLTINLKTAEEIGLVIPDKVLMQATTIAR